MTRLLALAIALFATPALAQQTANEQALLSKLSQEMTAGLSCTSALITAQARIKELEAKIPAKIPAEAPKGPPK